LPEYTPSSKQFFPPCVYARNRTLFFFDIILFWRRGPWRPAPFSAFCNQVGLHGMAPCIAFFFLTARQSESILAASFFFSRQFNLLFTSGGKHKESIRVSSFPIFPLSVRRWNLIFFFLLTLSRVIGLISFFFVLFFFFCRMRNSLTPCGH